MLIDSCVGVDPGPTTGIAFLDYQNGVLAGRTVLQCESRTAEIVLRAMLRQYYMIPDIGKRVASVERFVTGRSAGARGPNADVTRQLVMELTELLEMFAYRVKIRAAADVKPWASDRRLATVFGKANFTGSMIHGYDAARHALYGGHEAGVVKDPLLRHQAIEAQPGSA